MGSGFCKIPALEPIALRNIDKRKEKKRMKIRTCAQIDSEALTEKIDFFTFGLQEGENSDFLDKWIYLGGFILIEIDTKLKTMTIVEHSPQITQTNNTGNQEK